MKATFHIHYRTVWGERLKIILPSQTVDMQTSDGYLWTARHDMPESKYAMPYYYAVYVNEQCRRTEWHLAPHILNPATSQECLIFDNWRDIPSDAYLYSSAFEHRTGAIRHPAPVEKGRQIIFRILCSQLPEGYDIGVTGDKEALGNWNPERAIIMEHVVSHEWMTCVSAENLPVPFEYKFIAVSQEKNREPLWEPGRNRQWQRNPDKTQIMALPEAEIRLEQKPLRLAGCAIPVFSLRSESSFGAGDFGDLKKFIDWAALTHQKAVQILPINDSTTTHKWTDSYPYKSISVYALHPMYMDLNRLGKLKDSQKQAQFDVLQKKLNSCPDVDYEQTNNAKREFLRLKYQEDHARLIQTDEFKAFLCKNSEWLIPYAAYCYLRDKHHTPDFTEWPEYSIYRKEEIEKLCSPDNKEYDDIAVHFYIQYHLHNQLLDAGNYARQKGIILKGDIPIGVNRYSVESWTEPHYFNLNGQAGAPPDPFSANGQNWGFPTYNWKRMEEDNYIWWQKRLGKMAEYFTAYRIDHILGFFRIWEIPRHSVHGLLGQFVPSLPMSPQEIESFGLPFREQFFTRPYIDEELLNRIFENEKVWVKDEFLQKSENNTYKLKPEFSTQRQVEQHFKGRTDKRGIRMREGLYSLISNVLFVPDRNRPNRYHPRIAAQTDYLYTRLDRYEKEAFDRLYEHYYYQRHNQFWYKEAMKKLPVLTQCTPMLACGEDLGMIPECVPWAMKELRILSLEIERMPKAPGYEFGNTDKYPYGSVCTLSTHDMSTLREWWEESAVRTEHYCHNVLKEHGPVPKTANGNICRQIIQKELDSPSMLCILSFQDWTSIDEQIRCKDVRCERINVPSNPLNYWHYRMHVTIEQLMKAENLNGMIRNMIDKSDR